MVGVELVDPDAPQWWGAAQPDGGLARRVQQEMLARGVIVEVGGRHDAVVRFLPPLVIDEPVVDRVAEAFGECARRNGVNESTFERVRTRPFLDGPDGMSRLSALAGRVARRSSTGTWSPTEPVDRRRSAGCSPPSWRRWTCFPTRGCARSGARRGRSTRAGQRRRRDPPVDRGPPALPDVVDAVAMEVAIGATNQSMDSFDQAPAATLRRGSPGPPAGRAARPPAHPIGRHDRGRDGIEPAGTDHWPANTPPVGTGSTSRRSASPIPRSRPSSPGGGS